MKCQITTSHTVTHIPPRPMHDHCPVQLNKLTVEMKAWCFIEVKEELLAYISSAYVVEHVMAYAVAYVVAYVFGNKLLHLSVQVIYQFVLC